MKEVTFRHFIKKRDVIELIKIIANNLSLNAKIICATSQGEHRKRLYHYIVYFNKSIFFSHNEIVLVGLSIDSPEAEITLKVNKKYENDLNFVLSMNKKWMKLVESIK